jgi:hypothetical protein
MNVAVGIPTSRRAVDPAPCRPEVSLERADGAFPGVSVSSLKSQHVNDFVINHLGINDLVMRVSYGSQRSIPRRCGQGIAQEAWLMWLLNVGNPALRITPAVALQVLTGVSVEADVLAVDEGAFGCRRVVMRPSSYPASLNPIKRLVEVGRCRSVSVDTNVSLGFDNRCHHISPTRVTASEGHSNLQRALDRPMPVTNIRGPWFQIPVIHAASNAARPTNCEHSYRR